MKHLYSTVDAVFEIQHHTDNVYRLYERTRKNVFSRNLKQSAKLVFLMEPGRELQTASMKLTEYAVNLVGDFMKTISCCCVIYRLPQLSDGGTPKKWKDKLKLLRMEKYNSGPTRIPRILHGVLPWLDVPELG